MKIHSLVMAQLLSFISQPAELSAQSFIQGTVVDEKTKSGVPYATIGLIKVNRGINADEHGNFNLRISHNNDDTIIISSVGYETLKIPLPNAKTDTIRLKPRENRMRSVTITNKKDWSSETVGKFDDCGDAALVSSGFQVQLAKLFHSDHDNALLSSVTICHKPVLFSSGKSIFRIRVYDQDSITGQPSTELYDEPIEVHQDSKWTEVNLEQYHIWLPHKTFFVAIEWLKISYNEKDDSKKTKIPNHITYSPQIGVTYIKIENRETWMLTYRNVWTPMIRTEASISATIKY